MWESILRHGLVVFYVTVLAAVAFAGPAAAAVVPVSSAPSPYVPGEGSAPDATAQGFIMSDGRICNPRWGC